MDLWLLRRMCSVLIQYVSLFWSHFCLPFVAGIGHAWGSGRTRKHLVACKKSNESSAENTYLPSKMQISKQLVLTFLATGTKGSFFHVLLEKSPRGWWDRMPCRQLKVTAPSLLRTSTIARNVRLFHNANSASNRWPCFTPLLIANVRYACPSCPLYLKLIMKYVAPVLSTIKSIIYSFTSSWRNTFECNESILSNDVTSQQPKKVEWKHGAPLKFGTQFLFKHFRLASYSISRSDDVPVPN